MGIVGLVSMIVFYLWLARVGTYNEIYTTYIWPVSIGSDTFTIWREYALYFSLPMSLVGFVIGTLFGSLPTAPVGDSETVAGQGVRP